MLIGTDGKVKRDEMTVSSERALVVGERSPSLCHVPRIPIHTAFAPDIPLLYVPSFT